MSEININSSTRTEISLGSCTIYNSGIKDLITLTNEAGFILDKTYANSVKVIYSDSTVYAKSSSKNITLLVNSILTTGGGGGTGTVGPKGPTGEKGEPGTDGLAGQNIIDQHTQLPIKLWTGTVAEYDAIAVKEAATLYMVKE